MSKNPTPNPALDAALAEVISHVRDVSPRDGIQSWDENKWKIKDVITLVTQENEFAKKIKEVLGIEMNPVEAWGGGQFAQPAKFLFEDPFMNLQKIKAAAPDLKLQALMRGRQCLGFKPVSDSVQEAAFKSAARHGIEVFRVFDMMNDIRNVEPSIKAFKEAKKEFPNIRLEGAVSFVSEPEGKKAWTHEEYADYAVKLAEHGCDEIAIKNYAGGGDKEIPDLVRTIRKKLDDSGYKDTKLNLHHHGQKPETLRKALEAGADKVDVAIGELSGGPSHTNMRDFVHLMLESKGFSKEDIDAHPVMQQLEKVEAKISEIVDRKDLPAQGAGNPVSFNDLRAPLKKLTEAGEKEYPMAAGAISSLLGMVRKEFSALRKSWDKGNCIDPKIEKTPETEGELFKLILEDAVKTWEKAGRPNLVTPGAKFLADQQYRLTVNRLNGKTHLMGDYMEDFKDLVTGRFGNNQGMDKGIGDQNFRDALMMYNAMKLFNNAANKGQVSSSQRDLILMDTQFGSGSNRIKVKAGKPTFDLLDPKLESVLMESNILEFEKAVMKAQIPIELKRSMLDAMSLERSQTPTTKLKNEFETAQMVHEKYGTSLADMHHSGKPISQWNDVALLSELIKPDDFHNMMLNIVNDRSVSAPVAREGGVSRA